MDRKDWADPVQYGTLYQTLKRTAAKWGSQTAYGVPAMAGRPYHPHGKEYIWAETLALVEEYKAIYARSGYGYGHRIAFLFGQRPRFLFHYFALNALGCSVVLLNPEGTRLLRSWRHVEHCPQCGGNQTAELSLDELRGASLA